MQMMTSPGTGVLFSASSVDSPAPSSESSPSPLTLVSRNAETHSLLTSGHRSRFIQSNRKEATPQIRASSLYPQYHMPCCRDKALCIWQENVQ